MPEAALPSGVEIVEVKVQPVVPLQAVVVEAVSEDAVKIGLRFSLIDFMG